MLRGVPLALLVGTLLDGVLGDPRRGHPVAVFGQLAASLEARLWADSRPRGAVYAGALVGGAALVGVAGRRSWAVTAAATWTVLGGTSLVREGQRMRSLLAAGEIPAARQHLGHLCGRDATALDAAELSRATVESIAENTSDAVVAPLFWGAVAGLPGLLAYRAANTLDAMVGHRSPRYARFGWAAARLDDVANWVPARITGLLAAALAPAVGGSSHRALRTMFRDGADHPSPNAGQCEAAFAGALGVRLGGANRYGDHVDVRGTLGSGRPPAVDDIARAAMLSRLVGAAAAVLFALSRKALS